MGHLQEHSQETIQEFVDEFLENKRHLREQEKEKPAASGPSILDKVKQHASIGNVGLAGAAMGVGMLAKHALGSGKRKRLKQQKDWWKNQAQHAQMQKHQAQAHSAGLQAHISGLRGQQHHVPQQPSMGYHGPAAPQHNVYHPPRGGGYGYGY